MRRDPGEVELNPPPEPRRVICEGCGLPINGPRRLNPLRRFHNDRCRSFAFRERKRLEALAPRNGHVPEPRSFTARPCRCEEGRIPQLEHGDWSCFKCGSPLGAGR